MGTLGSQQISGDKPGGRKPMMLRVSLGILLYVSFQGLSGCLLQPTMSEERYRQALQLIDQGTNNIRGGRLQEANTAFSMAEELAPIAAAVDGQGCVALLLGDFDLAERLFLRAYNMDGTYDYALANLALLNDIRGKRDEAKRLYNSAVASLPESVAARNNRAALEYDLGEGKMKVVNELEKAKLVAEHHVVVENLSRLERPMPAPVRAPIEAQSRRQGKAIVRGAAG